MNLDYILDKMVSSLTNGVWAVVGAAVILVIAMIVASIVRKIVMKVLSTGKVRNWLNNLDGDASGGLREFIGKLVYLLVFLLFVPAIFRALNMDNVTAPISNVLNVIWGYVPNLFAAAIVLFVGSMIAKIVRQLLIPVFNKINLDKLQTKAGIEVPEKAKLSNTLAYVVYVLILVPTIVMALTVLDISVITEPANKVLNTVFAFIPNIAVAIILVVIGSMIGKFAGQIVSKLLASSGLDNKLAGLVEQKYSNFVLSKVTGTIVNVVIVIFFIVEGVNVLKLDVLTVIGERVIGYMPAVLFAVLILMGCVLVSSIVEKVMKKNGFNTYATAVKVAIIVVGVFMVLSELGIAAQIVNTAFIIVLAALAIAFAVAFGIGGRDFAARTLEKLEEKKDDEE